MPSRVLLVSVNRCTNPDAVFPLGLAFVAGALRRAGHEVRWHDILASEESLESTLKGYRPDCVGLSLRNIDDVILRKQEVFFDQLQSICEVAHRVAQCPVILGGSGFSIFPGELMGLSGADYGIVGPGEAAMVALVSALEAGRSPHSIPGLAFFKDGRPITNPPSCEPNGPRENPEYTAPIISFYVRNTATLNVQTQRGCPFHCCYCTYPLLEGHSNRRRPPEQIAADFAQAIQLGAKYLFVVDSVFNSSHRHVQETCEALIRHNVRVPWGCFLRPQNLTADLMNLMGRAGLAHIEFGSDSFSDKVLEQYQKNLTFEDLCHSSYLAREAGIEFCHFLICGGPGETVETLHESFRNSQHLPGSVIMAMPGMRIYPGTPVFERAIKEGLIRADSDLLRPAYYSAPGLTPDIIFKTLRDFSRTSPNWIVGDPSPAFTQMVERLRKRGIMGPAWSYASIVQRLWPGGFSVM